MFKITSLESNLRDEIQKIRQEKGLNPVTIRQDLYKAAFNHIRSILKNNNTNLNDKIETREKMFWNAKQYTEINFVTKPCDSDPIQTIVSIIQNNFIPQITSQINAIGPVIIKLKSNKYIVSIFCAYFNPKISLREIFERIPDIKTSDSPSYDTESLIILINRLREMVPYQPFDLKKVEPTNESEPQPKNIYSKVYRSKTSSELFCKLLADTNFFNLITKQWNDFSYSATFSNPNHHIKLNFIFNNEKYVYEIVLKDNSTENKDPNENQVVVSGVDGTNKDDDDDLDKLLEEIGD